MCGHYNNEPNLAEARVEKCYFIFYHSIKIMTVSFYYEQILMNLSREE